MLQNQTREYMERKFSKYVTRFGKKYSTKHCLFNILHQRKSGLDKGFHILTIFIDLSNVFHILNNSLLQEKLPAYTFVQGLSNIGELLK